MTKINQISGVALWLAYCDKKEENEKQQQEISELKAMVNVLKDTLGTSFFHESEFEFNTWKYKAKFLLNKAPAQCLADVKADAVELATKECIREGCSIYDHMLEHANKLRKQK